LIGRRRIEIWQSADKGIVARRLYDEGGALVAGDWRASNGVQTLYHHGIKPQLQLAPEKRKSENAGLNFEQVWQVEPSARDFRALVANAGGISVEDKGTAYVLSFDNTNQQAGIVKASLTLNRADLHATEMFLVVASDAKDNGQNSNRQSTIGNRQLV